MTASNSTAVPLLGRGADIAFLLMTDDHGIPPLRGSGLITQITEDWTSSCF